MTRLSIILPTLDEEAIVDSALAALQPLRARGHELILVDGGSTDATVARAVGRVDQILITAPGRARQMNAGAAVADGEILVFLHADSRLPEDADTLIETALRAPEKSWGHFKVRLSGKSRLLRLIERMMNLRSRLTGIATGDLAIFVRRTVYADVGGFPEIALMEDIALSRFLKRHGRPVCLRAPVLTSSRRWETAGVLRTIVKMWLLRLAYFFKADPAALARHYRDVRC